MPSAPRRQPASSSSRRVWAGTVAIGAPVRADSTGSGSGRRCSGAAVLRAEVRVCGSHERASIDSEGERAANQLAPEGTMSAWTDTDLEVIPRLAGESDESRGRAHAVTEGTKLGGNPVRRRTLPLRNPSTSVPPSTWKRMTSRSRYARVPTPVPRIATERDLLASVPVLDEERAASDRFARLRILDFVPPYGRQVFAQERVTRQDPPEQAAERPKRERSTTLTVFASSARTLRTSVRSVSSGAPCFRIA